jgi:CBS-domain-containing membrane protein
MSDNGLKMRKLRYASQCTLAACSVFAILLLLDAMSDTLAVTVLGASSFIAFTRPESHISKPRLLIGGYVIGIASGCFCHTLCGTTGLNTLPIIGTSHHIVMGALAVGLAIFLMVITGTEHPPAAGLALAFVLGGWDRSTVVVTIAGIIALSAIKELLRPRLIDLL